MEKNILTKFVENKLKKADDNEKLGIQLVQIIHAILTHIDNRSGQGIKVSVNQDLVNVECSYPRGSGTDKIEFEYDPGTIDQFKGFFYMLPDANWIHDKGGHPTIRLFTCLQYLRDSLNNDPEIGRAFAAAGYPEFTILNLTDTGVVISWKQIK